MSNSKPLTTVTTGRPGRPAAMHKRAAQLIGSAGVEALRNADLYLISGSLARELALLVEAPPKSDPTPLETASEQAGMEPLGVTHKQTSQSGLLSHDAPVNTYQNTEPKSSK